jgi:hypothetical protein
VERLQIVNIGRAEGKADQAFLGPDELECRLAR